VTRAARRAAHAGRAILVASLFVAPAVARAYDFTIGLRTIGQGYQVRRFGPTGADELLTRRRLTQFLNLSVYNMEPESWRTGDDGRWSGAATLYFDASLRFESDFGGYTVNRPTGSDEIRELSQSQIDVLYAVFGGRNIGGRLDFELGRQFHFDLVDFYAFDGGRVRVRLARPVAVEAFGGTEVRGELPLSAPLYELDGTSAGSRDPATRPAQNSVLRPLAGAALVLGDDSGWPSSTPFWLRIAYRRMWSATADRLPGEPETGVNDEKLALTASADFRPWVSVIAGARYNLLLAELDDEQLAVRVRLPGRQSVTVEHVFQAPTFDGDSIWNIFSVGAYRDFRLNYEIGLGTAVTLYARGFYRVFEATSDETAADGTDLGAEAPGGRRVAGGSAGAYVRGDNGMVRADGYWDGGYGGRKAGVDLSARWAFRPRKFELEGRLTAYSWRSDLQPTTDAGFVAGGQAGGRWELGNGIRVHLVAEDNVGTFYSSQYRALLIAELNASL
jgi:hypothetical protein